MVAPVRPRPAVARPTAPPVRMATVRALAKSLFIAAAVVRTLPRVASHMPRKPIEADAVPPTRKASVRKKPEPAKPRATSPVSFLIVDEVRNTMIASGITITAMVRNWRVM